MEEFINNDTIVKDDVYKVFKESVSCPLCFNILINPIMCSKCQIVFCKSCISKLDNKGEKCPNNCTDPNYQNSIGKNEILSKLKFNCKKCSSIIPYDNVKNHQKTCNQNQNIANVNVNKVEEKKERKIKKITLEEVDKYKREGNSVTLITGK